jgi:uncharacterized protein YbjQ (UPF0145 family)
MSQQKFCPFVKRQKIVLKSFYLYKKTMVNQELITTSTSLEGYKITKHLGIVRGITVRSRGLGGNFVGGIQTLFGGKIGVYVNLCEQAREEAYQLMLQHATERGANAVLNMRYDANEVMAGVTEVLAYGTAVVVEKV